MGRHSVDDDPPTDLVPRVEPVTEVKPVWVDEPTVLVAGPGSPHQRGSHQRGPRARALVLVGGTVTLTLALLTLVLALVPEKPVDSSAAGPAPSAVDGAPTPGRPTAGSPVGAPTPTPTGPVATVTTGAPATSTSGPAGPVAPGGQPSPSPSLTATVGLTGVYSTVQSWPGGFIAKVLLTNATTTAQSWQVVIEYPDTVTGYHAGWSNAQHQPATVTTAQSATITGQDPLPANQTVEVSVQFNTSGTSTAPTPTRCTVNTAACA